MCLLQHLANDAHVLLFGFLPSAARQHPHGGSIPKRAANEEDRIIMDDGGLVARMSKGGHVSLVVVSRGRVSGSREWAWLLPYSSFQPMEYAMAEERSGYKHSASDRKLDHSAEAANESGQTSDTQHSSGAGHDPEKIR